METSSGLMPQAEPVRRVLVIDDELDHTEIVAALLRREGYAVEVANDARSGVHRAVEEPPDLILLDLWMPAVDGYKAAQLLRSDPRTRHVPVIFLSACGELVAEANNVDLEEMDYLAKPFHAVELLELAAAALRK
jgi:DNA-binding response OmpR family regulator